MRKRLAALIVIVSVGLAGCSKDKDTMTLNDYKDLANNYQTLYNESEAKVEGLQDLLHALDPTLPELEGIEGAIEIPDGSKPVLSINGKILLKNPLSEEGYDKIPNQSKIYLNDSVGVVPTDNWTFNIAGDSLRMEHTSSIYGEIKSYAYVGEFNSIDCYAGIVVPYLEGLGISKYTTKTLFVGDTRTGYTTNSTINVADVDGVASKDKDAKKKVKKKKYALTYGVAINNGKIVIYQFTYKRGSGDAALQEIVDSTIKQISMDGSYIKTE